MASWHDPRRAVLWSEVCAGPHGRYDELGHTKAFDKWLINCVLSVQVLMILAPRSDFEHHRGTHVVVMAMSLRTL